MSSSSSGASSGKPPVARVSSSMFRTTNGLHADLWAGGEWPSDMSRSSAWSMEAKEPSAAAVLGQGRSRVPSS